VPYPVETRFQGDRFLGELAKMRRRIVRHAVYAALPLLALTLPVYAQSVDVSRSRLATSSDRALLEKQGCEVPDIVNVIDTDIPGYAWNMPCVFVYTGQQAIGPSDGLPELTEAQRERSKTVAHSWQFMKPAGSNPAPSPD
jgi:hypothetical protein